MALLPATAHAGTADAGPLGDRAHAGTADAGPLGDRAHAGTAAPATLPAAAQTDAPYPDPLPITGQRIIHDPTVLRLKSGQYVAYSTGGVIGARLSRDLLQWDDAGNAFGEPPSWWYEYNGTGDPWAPDLSYRANSRPSP
ncbi:family 43 glycosylhydrolase [Streptomyces shaanxiensis]